MRRKILKRLPQPHYRSPCWRPYDWPRLLLRPPKPPAAATTARAKTWTRWHLGVRQMRTRLVGRLSDRNQVFAVMPGKLAQKRAAWIRRLESGRAGYFRPQLRRIRCPPSLQPQHPLGGLQRHVEQNGSVKFRPLNGGADQRLGVRLFSTPGREPEPSSQPTADRRLRCITGPGFLQPVLYQRTVLAAAYAPPVQSCAPVALPPYSRVSGEDLQRHSVAVDIFAAFTL